MIETTALAYGLLAGFLIQSTSRNRRAGRPHGKLLLMTGHVLMSASFTLALLLLGWVAWQLAGSGMFSG